MIGLRLRVPPNVTFNRSSLAPAATLHAMEKQSPPLAEISGASTSTRPLQANSSKLRLAAGLLLAVVRPFARSTVSSASSEGA